MAMHGGCVGSPINVVGDLAYSLCARAKLGSQDVQVHEWCRTQELVANTGALMASAVSVSGHPRGDMRSRLCFCNASRNDVPGWMMYIQILRCAHAPMRVNSARPWQRFHPPCALVGCAPVFPRPPRRTPEKQGPHLPSAVRPAPPPGKDGGWHAPPPEASTPTWDTWAGPQPRRVQVAC
jgi:hypothetical protein